jgi:hypothetical protein
MIRIIVNPYRLNATVHLGCHDRRFFSSLQTAKKVDANWQNMKASKNLDERATSLIFGDKPYVELSRLEQKIVDAFQQRIFKEDGVVLPNTGAALEQAELEQLLHKHLRDKGNE